MQLVERSAKYCEQLIPKLEAFYGQSGSYPDAIEELGAASTDTDCQYLNQNISYQLFVPGNLFNLQVYEYDSSRGKWRWD